jgi:hypothetical protein
MPHIVLLGDSIFDNRSYVGGEPDVISHLKNMVAPGGRATLMAVDGSLVENVAAQFQERPPDATHLVVSTGGNNAIMNADVLGLRVNSAAEVFESLSNRAGDFEFHYRSMLETVLSADLPTAVCTVYFPNFTDPVFQKLSVAALSVFNDVIIRQAIIHGLPFIDLRLVCSEADDYANEIEPSGKGGKKIAAAIHGLISEHDFSRRRCAAYV